MANRRVTLRDIAEKLGMHHGTISRALKNDRRIREKTRARIVELADKMGYRPDPMLSALMAYRTQNMKRNQYEGTMGWITNYPTRDGWRESENVRYFTGAKRHAVKLGYKIEDFWLHEPGMTARRMTNILLSRNIRGLLFVPQPRSRAHLRLDWDQFSAVTMGPTLLSPPLLIVDNDNFHSMMICMRQLKRLGYRRPGFVCEPRINNSNDRTWEAAFRIYQSLPLHEQIPSFVNQVWSLREFQRWYEKYRPDVIVSQHVIVLNWLKELGIDVPGEVGFASAAKHGTPDYCAGIEEPSEIVGEAAVDILANKIIAGERGISPARTSYLVAGWWKNGMTVRRQNTV